MDNINEKSQGLKASTFLNVLADYLAKKKKTNGILMVCISLLLPAFICTMYLFNGDKRAIWAMVFVCGIGVVIAGINLPKIFSDKQKYLEDLAKAFYVDGITPDMLDQELRECNIKNGEKFYKFTQNYIICFGYASKDPFNVARAKDIAFVMGERTSGKNSISYLNYDGENKKTLPQKSAKEIGAIYTVRLWGQDKKYLRGFKKQSFFVDTQTLGKTVEIIDLIHNNYPYVVIGKSNVAQEM